jgi:hypothetical protein
MFGHGSSKHWAMDAAPAMLASRHAFPLRAPTDLPHTLPALPRLPPSHCMAPSTPQVAPPQPNTFPSSELNYLRTAVGGGR